MFKSLRQSYLNKGLHESATKLICTSWRESTKKLYVNIIIKWQKYCQDHKISECQKTHEQGINFLAELFKNGASYNKICLARSALSSFVFNDNFGSKPIVSRFMKGVFEARPQFKYSSKIPRWDAGQVLKFISSWYPNKELNLKELTLKCTFLIIMCTGQRIQTLAQIKIDNIIFSDNLCHIVIDSLLKHSRRNKQQEPLEIIGFEDNESICPLLTLKEYIERTKDLRSNNQYQDKLFISYRKPHQNVSCDTLSRWIKNVLTKAGVTDTINAYSVRAISTSTAAAAGIPISEILRAAGWSNSNTFAVFYKKDVNPKFGSYMKGKLSNCYYDI